MNNFVEHLKVKNPNIDVDKLFVATLEQKKGFIAGVKYGL